MEIKSLVKHKNDIMPEGFSIDPHLDRFVYFPPHDQKNINFSISGYNRCFPIFRSKVAGVTHEGRDIVIRKFDSMVKNGIDLRINARLEVDKNNIHHPNAIKVIVTITDNIYNPLTNSQHVGFLPKNLANFVRYVSDMGVYYYCETAKISTTDKWVSIKLTLFPTYDVSVIKAPIEEEVPVRTPIAKKTITGITVEDFRKALQNKQKRNK